MPEYALKRELAIDRATARRFAVRAPKQKQGETIATPSGSALIVPPAMVVEGAQGEAVGVTPADLAFFWQRV